MRFLTNTSTDPYFNLAFDEYCLEHVRREETYFFLWRNRPSVIVGLNQNVFSEVNLQYLETHGVTLARRVTGGGAVYHDLQNLNYTIIGKDPSPEPVAEALRTLGADVMVTGRNDMFLDGKKCSGYARRVSHGREIIHGTLMYDVDLETLSRVLDVPGSKMNAKGIASVKSRVCNLKDHLPQFASLDGLQEALQGILSAGDTQMELTPEDIAQVKLMAETKFSTWDFIYGHSRQADFSRKAKLPCGTVEASFKIDRGIISGVDFSGDFLFGEAPGDLAGKLVGRRFEASDIKPILEGTDIGAIFPGTTSGELLSSLFGLSQEV